jgi:SEC-C motif-containing protein
MKNLCPCGSKLEYTLCCEPFLKGESKPDTAEKLMRSRYTAFTKANIDYLKKTLTPEARKDFDAKEAKSWAQSAKWKSLEILSTVNGMEKDSTGTVEFMATYEIDGEGIEHHEVSKFKKGSDGNWYFVDGESHTHKEGEGHHDHHHHHKPIETYVRAEPKIGRNDPCHCGSGKKLKKCHGA